MKIKYCRRYSKYLSKQHCEFFNGGDTCGHSSQGQWKSIKELAQDRSRPEREVSAILKPFHCNLMDQQHLGAPNLNHPHRVRMEQRI
jgi:hypothetical protein